MKILQVIPYFSPKMGGVAEVVYQVSSYLARQGHQVTVIAGDYASDQATFPENGFQRVVFRSFSKWGFYFTPGMFAWLRKHIREYDIIHVHEVRTFQNILVSYFSRLTKIPYVLSAHGTLPLIVEKQAIKKLFDWLFGSRIIHQALKVVAVSGAEVAQYRQSGVDSTKIQIIHNGLNVDDYRELPRRGLFREKFRIASDAKTILFLGRLHRRKKIDILIDAFAAVNKNIPRLKLVIAGPDGGVRRELEDQAERLGVQSDVVFTGPLYRQEKYSAYVDSDLFVSAGEYEIFGLTCFEAILCGTPVIVGNDCGSGEIIGREQAGYIVKTGDILDLARVIEQVLKTPEEAAKTVLRGCEFITKNIDWKIVVTKLECIYRDISLKSNLNGKF